MTAKELYKLLIDAGVKNGTGNLVFNFLDSSVTVTAKSAVGYVFQDWLEKWMETNNILYKKDPNSQSWPDFFLDGDESNIKGLVEVKTFDASKNPNFDIANFDAYLRSIKTHAYRLDADYLIFCYDLDGNGNFCIKDLWLKKVWNITCPSNGLPIKCQVKQKVIYNIRPAIWYSKRMKNKLFGTRKKFVKAIHKTMLKFPKKYTESKQWFDEVVSDYKTHTNRDL